MSSHVSSARHVTARAGSVSLPSSSPNVRTGWRRCPRGLPRSGRPRATRTLELNGTSTRRRRTRRRSRVNQMPCSSAIAAPASSSSASSTQRSPTPSARASCDRHGPRRTSGRAACLRQWGGARGAPPWRARAASSARQRACPPRRGQRAHARARTQARRRGAVAVRGAAARAERRGCGRAARHHARGWTARCA